MVLAWRAGSAGRWLGAAGAYGLVVLTAALFNQAWPGMFGAFIVACMGLPLLSGRRRAIVEMLGLRRQGWAWAGALSAGALLACVGAALALVAGYLRGLFVHPGLADTMHFLTGKAALVLPLALAEEFFFRAYLQEGVFAGAWGGRGWGPLTHKNLATGSLFALAHVLSRQQPAALLLVFGGVLMGWVMERSGRSVWPAVALHAASNMAVAWLVWVAGLNRLPWL